MHAPYSPEAMRAQEDGDYARGLRALVKRRNAIRMAEPFHVACLAVGSRFVYSNGVLCYNTERGQLRLLDIKNSAGLELVVDVFEMLRENHFTLPEFSGHKLIPINYGHGVLTSELRLRERPSVGYLFAVRPHAAELLFVEEQPLDGKTIVTTSEKYLFLCHPVLEPHPAFWGIRKFDLETREWVHTVPRFVSRAKRDNNLVACTVYGNHVYIVSGGDPLIDIRRSLPGGAFTKLSYQATRLPLEGPPDHPLEVEFPLSSWARPYSGDMCREDWNFLGLETDEETGYLGAVQIRMEYPDKGPVTERKCIKRVLAFPDAPSAPPPLTNIVNGTTSSLPLGDEHWGANGDSVPGVNVSGPHVFFSINAGTASEYQGFGFPPPGLPPKTTVHFGDNSSTTPAYGTGQCFLRSYFSTSNSFVDLVNDTLRRNDREQSLRLRVMTEIPGGGNETVFWPPKYDPLNPDVRLKGLHRILNRDGFDGDVEWDVDSSSFVYSIQSHNNPLKRAIIYVGFDPTVKLHNLRSFNKTDPEEFGAGGNRGSDGDADPDPPTQEKADTNNCGEAQTPSFPSLGASWAWLEEPVYFKREMGGYDFFA